MFNPVLRARFDLDTSDDELISISSAASKLLPATLRVWEWARRRYTPGTTGMSVCYNFGLQDVDRIVKGLCKAPLPTDGVQQQRSDYVVLEQDADLVSLWMHEVERVFADRFSGQ